MKTIEYNMITVLGPTATGKTGFAAHLAKMLNGEIISADSRQVYKEMNLGTGKDYVDYIVDGETIPYHLIDIVDPGSEYNVFQYQNDFITAFEDISSRNKFPLLCGGTGMYLETILNGKKLVKVPDNPELRENLKSRSTEELVGILSEYRQLHNTTDSVQRERTIRAIEIEVYKKDHPETDGSFPEIRPLIFGLKFDRPILRERITRRLHERLDMGMVEEVENLIKSGVEADKLKFYGLEYKFLTQFILGELSYDEMFRLLNIAIHQFAKRQETWFRRMEKKGFEINWIAGDLSMEEKLNLALRIKRGVALEK